MKLLWRFALIVSVPVWGQTVSTINPLPSREFGQARLDNPVKSLAPNLVEGRELNGPSAIAFDTSVNPPILYVADTLNSRVLAWKNPAGLTKGKPADLVIGQRDFFSTVPQGPGRAGSDLPGGLARPVGLAVDGSSNLYVMDSANNRILRYKNPFNQPNGQVLSPDLVIGQTSTVSGIQPNGGNPVSDRNLNLSVASTIPLGAIAFDPQGNLWATDTGNFRVLRYPKDVLNQSPPPSLPAANAVIGQNGFFANVNPDTGGGNNQKSANVLRYPSALSFDSSGGLYVADSYGRVLYYANPGPSTLAADRILGVLPDVSPDGSPQLYPNPYSLAGGNSAGQPTDFPHCIFTYQGKVFVCDSAVHRVVRYEAPAQWAAVTLSALSPAIASVVGQPDLKNGCDSARTKCTQPNRGLAEPDATTLSLPLAGVFDPAGNLWICDSGNNRVLTYPASASYAYLGATGVLGQVDSSPSRPDAFNHNAPNLVEGREVWISSNGSIGGGIVVDRNSNPPHLYVSDTNNNRILGFKDARVVGADIRSVLTTTADIVIGQPDLFRTTKNCTVTALSSPCTGDPQIPNDTGLSAPTGIALDSNGNLFVADTGNGRVLRFPTPFQNATSIQRANLVLGQISFGQPDLTTSQQTMRSPYGLVVFNDGNLGVSDLNDNRVLIFRKAGADFLNGQSAGAVVGQSFYNTTAASPSSAGLNRPLGLAADDSDRLYVSDALNNRISIFRAESSLTQGNAAANTVSISQPVGIAVVPPGTDGLNQRTIWVAAGGLYHLRQFDELTGTQADLIEGIQPVSAALAVGLDSFNNLIVGETSNRLSFYFRKLVYQNAANYTWGDQQQIAPGMMIYVTSGADLTADATPTYDPPWNTTVPAGSGLQVLVNGIPAPIFAVVPPYVFVVVPMGAPTSGTAEFLLTRPSTGQVLGASSYTMAPAAPAFFTANASGSGQIVAQNFSQSNSRNGVDHPVARGEVLTLWLTGQGPGFQGSAPPDGVPPTGALLTDACPLVYINASPQPLDCNNGVLGSAMTSYPGVWIINIKIPDNPGPACAGTVPSCDIPIYVRMRDFYSYYRGTATPGVDQKIITTTFRLKQ